MLATGELACYISLEPIDSCETLYYDRVNISKYNNYLRPNFKKNITLSILNPKYIVSRRPNTERHIRLLAYKAKNTN